VHNIKTEAVAENTSSDTGTQRYERAGSGLSARASGGGWSDEASDSAGALRGCRGAAVAVKLMQTPGWPAVRAWSGAALMAPAPGITA
jgi:hypothetical protein